MSTTVRCKEQVFRGCWSRRSGCSRKATRGGYCKQHHPDTVAEKRRKQNEESERRLRAMKHRQRIREAERLVVEAAVTMVQEGGGSRLVSEVWQFAALLIELRNTEV